MNPTEMFYAKKMSLFLVIIVGSLQFRDLAAASCDADADLSGFDIKARVTISKVDSKIQCDCKDKYCERKRTKTGLIPSPMVNLGCQVSFTKNTQDKRIPDSIYTIDEKICNLKPGSTVYARLESASGCRDVIPGDISILGETKVRVYNRCFRKLYPFGIRMTLLQN
jgi:hypothetical protein